MCLLVVAWQHHPDARLIAAGNRDEFHHRPTHAAAFWREHPQLLAGRDLEAGGTWMGVTREGRFAAVTNVREPGQGRGRRSRGELTTDFLAGNMSAADWAHEVIARGDDYAGFNLLVSDGSSLWYAGNRDPDSPRELEAGIHALSNHLLETPWPKLLRLRERFRSALEGPARPGTLLEILDDRRPAPPERLPDTGLPAEKERLLSAPFVVSPEYGTRAATVILLGGQDRAQFIERRFDPAGRHNGESPFSFTLEQRRENRKEAR